MARVDVSAPAVVAAAQRLASARLAESRLHLAPSGSALHPGSSGRARKPMHGQNQWPDVGAFPGFQERVLGYMGAMGTLAQGIMAGVALSMGLPPFYSPSKEELEALTLELATALTGLKRGERWPVNLEHPKKVKP